MFRRKRFLFQGLDASGEAGEEVVPGGRTTTGTSTSAETITESSSSLSSTSLLQPWRQQQHDGITVAATQSQRKHSRRRSSKSLHFPLYVRYFLGLLLLQASAIVILYSFLADSVITRKLRSVKIHHNHDANQGRYDYEDDDYDSSSNNNDKKKQESEVVDDAQQQPLKAFLGSNMDDSSNNNAEASQQPLDNYYSRQHIPQQSHNQQNQQQQQLPLLIVGGSDGSGTRAVADMLGRLGVPMLVDDTGTYDVDAIGLQYLGIDGWPPVVQRVLEWTATANYELHDLPSYFVDEILDEMDIFRETYQDRADKLFLDLEEIGRVPSAVASKILYGFKAPVSMLLLPILQQLYTRKGSTGRSSYSYDTTDNKNNNNNNNNNLDNMDTKGIKFLHVIRDGRDVALSSNQSPVRKFYDSFYTDAEVRRQLYDKPDDNELKFLMAMQLWNDWNIQVHEWCERHNDGENFDYLVVRSEDLLPYPSLQHRFETLLQLAHFVGSPRSEHQLCCLARQELSDMGGGEISISITTTKREIELFPDMDTLSDRGGGRRRRKKQKGTEEEGLLGLFDSNIEIMHQSWQESVGASNKVDNPVEEALKQLEKLQQKHHRRLSLVFDTTTTSNSTSNDDKAERDQADQNKTAGHHLKAREAGRDSGDYQNYAERMMGGSDDFREEEQKDDDEDDDFNLGDLGGEGAAAALDLDDDDAKDQKADGGGGSSGGNRGGDDIMQRYGKWKERLRNRPDVIALLHSEGSEALKTFGYHPRTRFQDRTSTEFTCDASITCDEYF